MIETQKNATPKAKGCQACQVNKKEDNKDSRFITVDPYPHKNDYMKNTSPRIRERQICM